MLTIRDLNVHYGGIHALRGIDIDVPDGKIISLIGANGAGKSTTLKSVMGLVPKSAGRVYWDGTDISLLKTKDVVGKGIILCPEGRRIFPDLTVDENLAAGAYLRKDKAGIARDRDWVYELFPRLSERTWQAGATLSGGEQQMLAVARSLMSRPRLLMLDEPSLGLAPMVIKDIFQVILKIKSDGVNILLVEQNAKAALEISDHAYVMETGVITMDGPGKELLNDPRVQHAYLGRGNENGNC